MYASPILFPQVTNRETFDPVIALYDDETGEPLDLSTITTIQVEVRCAGQGAGHFATPTVPWYDDGPGATPILSASLGNGVTVLDIGIFQIAFTETQMRTLRAGTYVIGCTVSDGTVTRQLFIGRLPVLDGGVTN